MSETSHTPGPWGMETVRTSCGVCHKIGPWPHKWRAGETMSACIYDDYPSPSEGTDTMLANARLIAAAPDMLAALRPFLPAYLAYVETMRSHVGSGETEAERRFSKGECRDAALENAFEELTKVTFDQLAAVAAAITKAAASTRRDGPVLREGMAS